MAEIRIIEKTVDLSDLDHIDYLSGVLHTAEGLAHQFKITAIRDDTPVALSGTVAGVFVRKGHGSDAVPLIGYTSGGAAYITLIPNCYLYSGKFELTIYAAADGATVALYNAEGNIDNTGGTSTVDPSSEITLDVNGLIADLAAAEASIPSDYSSLLSAIADTFSPSEDYVAGKPVWYGGVLYKFTVAHAAGSWTGTDVAVDVVGNELASMLRTDYWTYTAAQKTAARSNLNLNFMEGDPGWTDAQQRTAQRMLTIANMAPLFSPTRANYAAGDCVAYEDGYYLFIGWPEGETPAALGAWDWDKVEDTGSTTATKYWRYIPVSPQNVSYGNQTLSLTQKQAARYNVNVGNLAAEYDETHTGYAVGNCVIYQTAYYRCIRAITGEAGAWDWDKVVGTGSSSATKYWHGIAVTPEMVSYGAQTLTAAQQNKARENILANSIGIEPEWYGAKGDGVTNDRQALQYAFNEAGLSGRPVSLRAGAVYGVAGEYPWIAKRIQVYGNGATIKALDGIASSPSSCVLNIHSDEGQPPSLPGMGLIENLTIDCNGKTNIGLLISRAQGFQIHGLDIRTPRLCGLHVDGNYEIFANSIRVAGADPYASGTYPAGWRAMYSGKLYENTSGAETSANITDSSVWTELGTIDSASTVGVKVYNNDSHYTDIVTKNMGIGLQVGSPEGWGGGANFFTRIHSWNTDSAIIPTSVMFDIRNSTILTDCYCDTCMKAVKMSSAAAVEINGMYLLHGGSTYMSGMTPTVFDVPSASYATRIKASGMVNLSPSESYKCFSVDVGAQDYEWAQLNDESMQEMDNFPMQGPVSELKSIMYFSADGNAVYFVRGALGSSDGKTSSSTTRLCTGFLPRGTVSVAPKTGYKLMLFAYQADGTYVGVYNGTEFAKSGSWKTAALTIPNKTYLYRLVFANTSDSTIVTNDGRTNLEMVIATDQEMEKSGYAADAAAAGKILKSLTDHGPVNFLNPLSRYYTATELVSGVTFTYNADGSWAVSGTASSSSYHDIILHKPVAPGVYRVKLNGGSMTLRIFIEFPAGTSDTIIDAGRDKLITVPSNAVSITARFVTVNGTTYSGTLKYEMYRIADADLYQNGVVVATGDTTDRTLEIEFCLSNYGFCRLQKGVYYTSGVTMPDNTALYGDGWDAILALSGSSAGNAITLGSGCTVKNMQIRGTDEPLTMPPPSSDGNRNGIMLDGTNKSPKPTKGVIDGCWIHDFTGGGIRLQYTGYPSNGGMAISNCDIERNYCGIFNAEDSEFHKITNCSMTQNRYGCILNGANNLISCCNFSSNIYGFLMDNENKQKLNTAHGSVIGSSFMHNNMRTIIVKGMVSGFAFVGCNIEGIKYNDGTYNVPLLFKNSTNVLFSGCNFMNEFTEIEIDGQGATDGGDIIGNFILFNGSSFRPEFTTVTTKNGAVLSQVKFDNCYTWDGTAVDPTAN